MVTGLPGACSERVAGAAEEGPSTDVEPAITQHRLAAVKTAQGHHTNLTPVTHNNAQVNIFDIRLYKSVYSSIKQTCLFETMRFAGTPQSKDAHFIDVSCNCHLKQ